MKFIDYSRKQFPNFRVLTFEHVILRGERRIKWTCECKCGKTFFVPSGKLPHRKGCWDCRKRKYEFRGPEYNVWFKMIARCHDPTDAAYANYGGRGIFVCERWHKFENFIEDMGRRPSPKLQLDRKDNNQGYSKENCRWVTSKEQQRNRRNNRLHTINGETRTTAEWCERFGVRYGTFTERLRLGWSIEKALSDSRQYRLLTFNDETLSLAAWSRRMGISQDTLARRLDKHHWPIDRALTEPVRKQINSRANIQ